MPQHTTSSKTNYSFALSSHTLSHAEKTHCPPLHAHVEEALYNYFIAADGQPVTQLYDMLLSVVEPALLKVIFQFCKTQDEAAKVLGLSRSTLRKKLKQYQLITHSKLPSDSI